MNILFGLCGFGSRFSAVGYDIPKYLISYAGAPMIYHAVETLNIPGRISFVVKTDHLQKYKFLEKMLLALGDDIVLCNRETEGAAESLLLAKEHIIDKESPLISVNCDQYMDWDSSKFLKKLKEDPESSYILTFKETNPKCSYIKEYNNKIVEVREKKVISNDATVGVYHWAKTKDFFEDAAAMIADGYKENNEYYVAPVYNYSITRGLTVRKFNLEPNEFWPVGTPADLKHFIGHNTRFD